MHVKTIIIPKLIVPIRPENVVLENHFLAIDDGKIAAVSPLSELEQFQSEELIRLDDHVLMPGLVNAHTHAAMNLLRSVGPDLTTPDWLEKCIWPIEGKLMSPDFVYDGSILGAAEMLLNGTTTAHDMYFFPSESIKALRHVGMRVVQGAFVINFPSKYKGSEEEYLSEAARLIKEFRGDPLVKINIAPHAPFSVSKEMLQKSMALAEELDLSWQIHLSETGQEVKEAKKNWGCTPVQYLHKIGVLNERVIGVHCVALEDEDIELLARAKSSVVHCPVSNMRLGCGAAPVPKLIEAGVNVALGTDGSASACKLDMFEQMRVAGMLAKGINKNPKLLSVKQLLEMGTINGAKALQLDAVTGTLEPGKAADIAAVDMSRFVTVPVLDVLSSLIYSVSGQCICKVWLQGELVADMQQGRLKKPCRETLLSESNVLSWQNRVCEILQGGFN